MAHSERDENTSTFQAALKAAQEGDASAQNEVAIYYAAGDGVAQDQEEALKWWRKAAAQHHPGAEFSIGNAYANGWGVSQNNRTAVVWWRMAAEREHPGAQYNLGDFSMLSKVLPFDPAQACMWFDRAAAGY